MLQDKLKNVHSIDKKVAHFSPFRVTRHIVLSALSATVLHVTNFLTGGRLNAVPLPQVIYVWLH